MNNEKLIKAYHNPRFKIELFETSENAYIIKYENNKLHGINYSEVIQDYKIASELFDMKLDELEGH